MERAGCAKVKSPAPKKRFGVKTVLQVLGIVAAGMAGYVVITVVMPALLFIGIIWISDFGAPTQDALIRVVEQNMELLERAVAEAEKLGSDAVEISTYRDTPGWRRETLGSIRGMYLRRDGGDGPDRYEALENDVLEQVLNLRYVESIHVAGEGFSLDCGATGIVPSGAEYGVMYEPGLLKHLQSNDTLGHWPCEKEDDGWRVSYGGDDSLLIVPIMDDWFYTKEVW